MRKNFPIVDEEYPFPSGRLLVSTTDLKGRITYCNPSFIEVSGFTRDELLGKPHNLIRHPDMPSEAFRDRWETISGGTPWTATVKNRRKDGTYYWVNANVTSILDSSGPVGYMSVRTEASRQQIDQASGLYATMRKEAADENLVHRLQGGEIQSTRLAARLVRALRFQPGTWISCQAGVIAALLF